MKESKILFTGGDGHLCSQFKKQNNPNFIFLNKEELDITDCDSIEYVFNNYEFDYIFHSAALSRPMILHDESPNLSININIVGTSNLVMYCNTYRKKIIYISTDYVYSGTDNQHKESSAVKPTNKYSWSKLGGECAVHLCDKYLIFRLGMVEYPFPHSHAFTNVYKSSIWSDEIPTAINHLLEKEGIYNIGGPSQSIYDFVKKRIPTISELKADGSVPKQISMNIEKIKRKDLDI